VKKISITSMNFYKIIQALLFRIPFFERQQCNICGHTFSRFLPYNVERGTITLPKVLNVVGSDTVNFECPWCGAHDRERHLLMYMRSSGLFARLPGMDVLHFAPERRLSMLIAAEHPVRYVKGDLYPTASDVERIDILDIPYLDGSFDLVIANHILEHVADDMKALKEVYRILKPAGHAIIQTPYSPKLHSTWSDKGIDNDQARLLAYGQKDHVRLFGRDIFERFASAGFTSLVQKHEQVLGKYDARRYGVNGSEPFFLFQREQKQ